MPAAILSVGAKRRRSKRSADVVVAERIQDGVEKEQRAFAISVSVLRALPACRSSYLLGH